MTDEQFNIKELEIYQQAREKAGMRYPGGAKQFAVDRVLGGSTFAQVMNDDLAHYLKVEQEAREAAQKPRQEAAPLSPQDQKDIALGRSLRAIVKEVR